MLGREVSQFKGVLEIAVLHGVVDGLKGGVSKQVMGIYQSYAIIREVCIGIYMMYICILCIYIYVHVHT